MSDVKSPLDSTTLSDSTGRTSGLLIPSVLGLAIAVAIIGHLLYMTQYPIAFIDESWNTNTAWTWLKTGINFDAMHAGSLDQLPCSTSRQPYIATVIWGIAFWLMGLGFFQARLISWFFGILLLLVTAMVGRKSYDLNTGLLAAILLSLSAPFLYASHCARPDIILAVIVMAGYAAALHAFEKNKYWAHFLAGFALGFSTDVHLNGIIFALGLGAVYLWEYRKEFLRQTGTWLAALGGLSGIVYYAVTHIMPNPSCYFALQAVVDGRSHKLPLMALDPVLLLESLRAEIGRYHFYENGLDFALIGAGLAFFVVRRWRADCWLIAFLSGSSAGFVLLVGNKMDQYAILFYPLFCVIIAETLLSIARERRHPHSLRVFAACLVALLLFNGAVHAARRLSEQREYDYEEITKKIAGVIPKNARVMGLPTWWLGLSEYDYRSSLNLTFYHFQDGSSLTESLETDRPDILIVDTGLKNLLVDQGYFPSNPDPKSVWANPSIVYWLPLQEFEDFLNLRGRLLLRFSNPWHGEFEIYSIQW